LGSINDLEINFSRCAWVAQSVEQPTLDFGSGQISGSWDGALHGALHTAGCLLQDFSPSPSAPTPTHVHALSLKKKKKLAIILLVVA